MKFDLLSTLQSPTYLSWSCSAGIISTKARCTIMYLYLCYVCIFSDKLQSVCKRKSAHFITFFCLQVGIQTSLPTYFLPAAIIVSTTTYIQYNANSKTIQQLCKILFRKKYIFFKCYILIYTILQDLFKFSELSSELEKNVIVVFFLVRLFT